MNQDLWRKVEELFHAALERAPDTRQSFLEGHMTPVLWGSALRHFGIDELLAAIGEWAPPPKTMKAHKAAPPLVYEPTTVEVIKPVRKPRDEPDAG